MEAYAHGLAEVQDLVVPVGAALDLRRAIHGIRPPGAGLHSEQIEHHLPLRLRDTIIPQQLPLFLQN